MVINNRSGILMQRGLFQKEFAPLFIYVSILDSIEELDSGKGIMHETVMENMEKKFKQ